MKWFKLIIGSLILLIIGLFIYQNLETFKNLQHFSLDLKIREPVTWSLSLYSLLIIAAILGLLVGFILMLKPYLNMRRLLAQEKQGKQQAKGSDQETPAGKEALETS